jgi:hypothetical protein
MQISAYLCQKGTEEGSFFTLWKFYKTILSLDAVR